MKQRMNAREKREAEALRRKGAMKPASAAPAEEPQAKPQARKPVPERREPLPQKTPEEETREFLEYLARDSLPVMKDDLPQPRRKKPGAAGTMPRLNLEDGMPLVEEALRRMNLGIQEMRAGRAAAVKLIHGYGSTGRGGKIRESVRNELASMKRKKLIRDYIPGEDFGPMDAAARKLAEQGSAITRDPDYGRMNHGITIVVL